MAYTGRQCAHCKHGSLEAPVKPLCTNQFGHTCLCLCMQDKQQALHKLAAAAAAAGKPAMSDAQKQAVRAAGKAAKAAADAQRAVQLQQTDAALQAMIPANRLQWHAVSVFSSPVSQCRLQPPPGSCYELRALVM